MTQVTLNIPDDKITFFMQLLKEFTYVKVQEVELPILEEHKQLVRDIKAKTKSELFLEADTMFQNLDEKIR
jgi:hypothetical protein